jgi:outer membrane immunogenic protein
MKKLLLPALALVALSTGSALAADLPMKAPAMEPAAVRPMSWTGCYLGAGGGYGMWNQKNTATIGGVAITEEATAGGDGWFGTVQGGCDYQINRWVIGAFADYDFADMDGKPTLLGFVGDETLSSSWSVGARIGFLVFPQLLTYVSGGYTEAEFDSVTIRSLTTGLPVGLHIGDRTYDGWFLGSGYEYQLGWLAPGLFWKTEYRFAEYDRQSNPVLVSATGLPLGGVAVDSEKYVQTVRTELVWRWNWGGGRW